jgi:hypothetical protein
MVKSPGPPSSEEEGALEPRLLEWLATEGYPLEFATARAFRKAGFQVRQGYYTHPAGEEPAREIDVVAQMDLRRDPELRVEFVVECKWSGDKPWVFFCGGSGITTAACVTQSIGSELGEALLWKEAGNSKLASLGIFATPDKPAFGGRQAFSGARDVLFDAMRSVSGAARAIADDYDRGSRTSAADRRLPHFAVAVFPVIVVTGRLFEVRQEEAGDLRLSEVASSRVHWRGARDQSNPHTTVDVVRSDHLEEFAKLRSTDSAILLEVMSSATDDLLGSLSEGSFASLNVTSGARGVLGLPRLLRRIKQLLDQTEELQAPSNHRSEEGKD